MKTYSEVALIPVPGRFAEWTVSPESGEKWADLWALIREIEAAVAPATVYRLGWDDLPAHIPDIRGRIHNEPAHVLAWRDPDTGDLQCTGIHEWDA